MLGGSAKLAVALIVLLCGLVASGFLYAMAGYGLAAEGPMARVSIVIATYSSIASGVAAAAALQAINRYRWQAMVFFLSALVALAGMGLCARSRISEWAEVWTYELARLSRLPDNVTFDDGRERAFLAIEDRAPSYLQPASAPWEIQGALVWATFRRSTNHDRRMIASSWDSHRLSHWFATSDNWFNRWDGHRFEQGLCDGHAAIYSSAASEFWVWRTSKLEMERIESPWEMGCK